MLVSAQASEWSPAGVSVWGPVPDPVSSCVVPVVEVGAGPGRTGGPAGPLALVGVVPVVPVVPLVRVDPAVRVVRLVPVVTVVEGVVVPVPVTRPAPVTVPVPLVAVAGPAPSLVASQPCHGDQASRT